MGIVSKLKTSKLVSKLYCQIRQTAENIFQLAK